jgi:hypothetical protein
MPKNGEDFPDKKKVKRPLLLNILIWGIYLFSTFSVSLYLWAIYWGEIKGDKSILILLLLFSILSMVILGETVLKKKNDTN